MLSFGVAFIVKIRYNRGKLSLEKDITMQDKLLMDRQTYWNMKKVLDESNTSWKYTHIATAVAFNFTLEKLQEQGVNIPDDIKYTTDEKWADTPYELGAIVQREKGLTPDDVVWQSEAEKAKTIAAHQSNKYSISLEQEIGWRYWAVMFNNELKRVKKEDVENAEIQSKSNGTYEVNIGKIVNGIKEREKGIALVKEMKSRNLVK